MDTPLYVLTTAASMVESVDVTNCQNIEEAALKRPLDVRDSSSRTTTTPSMLPTQDERLAAVRGRDQSVEASANSKKCTGTQTSFSSFNGSSSYGPSEKYVKTDSGSMAWPGHKSSCPASPPSYYNRHNTMATAPHHYGYQQEAMDTGNDMPLNLTKSSSSHQSNTSSASPPREMSSSPCTTSPSRQSPSSSSLTPRHTVIIRNAPSHQLTGGATHSMCNNSRQDKVLNDVDDPEIEEHFRRSLGTKYQSYVNSRSSPQNGETADPATGSWKPSNVSITGDVDDHFAKSLGDTWTQLKAQKQSAVLTGTVDDHFAKALGDTWFKIKAKTET